MFFSKKSRITIHARLKILDVIDNCSLGLSYMEQVAAPKFFQNSIPGGITFYPGGIETVITPGVGEFPSDRPRVRPLGAGLPLI